MMRKQKLLELRSRPSNTNLNKPILEEHEQNFKNKKSNMKCSFSLVSKVYLDFTKVK